MPWLAKPDAVALTPHGGVSTLEFGHFSRPTESKKMPT
jgi:hypothetical protein